jgi:hypothetical protein
VPWQEVSHSVARGKQLLKKGCNDFRAHPLAGTEKPLERLRTHKHDEIKSQNNNTNVSIDEAKHEPHKILLPL